VSRTVDRALRFSDHELRDLAVAWVALGVAFAVFFAGGGGGLLTLLSQGGFVAAVVVSLLTAGIGFLLHELAHKVAAVRFGQIAEFRADYGMLFLAVMSALAGFIFAAPGAVYHRGVLSDREHGLIALAGPAANIGLSLLFLPILAVGSLLGSGFVELLGARGLAINLFLAAFNMIPFGSLDGRTVLDWNTPVFLAVFVPSLVVAIVVVFVFGVGF
jgi:Zn-dependent protease